MTKSAIAPSFDVLELERKIRSDLNLEKRAIWKPTNSNTELRERVFEEKDQISKTETVTRKLEIMAVGNRGLLTTEDLKTYYALIEQWQEHGRPDGYTAFSLRKIAKRLGKHWSKNVSESLTNSLLRLRFVGFIWTNSYFNSEKKETEELVDTFTILPVLKIWRKKKAEAVHGERAYFKFHDLILTNIKNNYSKPVILPIHFGIKSEVGQILYGLLDRILAKKKFTYQKRTKELFEELGLEGKMYKYRSGRKQTLDKAIKELVGLPMSNGAILETVEIVETKDGKDFKLVVRRSDKIKNKLTSTNLNNKNTSIKRATSTDRLKKTDLKEYTPATFTEKLICDFESRMFDFEPKKPKKHHLAIVNGWIQEFGEETTKGIIEGIIKDNFSYRESYHSFGIVESLSRKIITRIKKRKKKSEKEKQFQKESEEFQFTKKIFESFSPEQQKKLRQKYEDEFKRIHNLRHDNLGKNIDLEYQMSDYADEKIQIQILNEYKIDNDK